MALVIWSFAGGLVGTVLMDFAAMCADRFHVTWGGCGGNAALGRWVLGIFKGRFAHENIIGSPHVKNEGSLGLAFHYLTGGSLALTYPLFYLAFPASMPAGHLMPCLVWGLATSAIPWFVLFPGFGWGLFGLRAPGNVRPLI